MTNNVLTDPRIDQLYSTLSLDRALNINRNAFNDISNVILSFHDKHKEEGIKWVCDASMGHGKSTVLISYLKWITQQEFKQPVLVSIREKELAYIIYNEVSKVAPNSIINIDSDNKLIYESDLYKFQIVIVQHQRLKNLALEFGNINKYNHYTVKKSKIKRLLIIDEKPDFYDSAIFDINSYNNVLDWFEDLSEPLNILGGQLQRFKSYVTFLLSEQLAENFFDTTTALLGEFKETTTTKNLLELLQQMEENEFNQSKYESLNKMKHFKKLLTEDKYGRIDEYSYHKKGRKIIISKLVEYSNLGMNILVFDGTERANAIQYAKVNFREKLLKNRNDYSRLTYQIDEINTTKYSRTKKNNPTQITISKRINELRKRHSDLFVLPMKDEINIYLSTGAIKNEDKHYYFDDKLKQNKGINLLNTTGKNVLKDKKSLYLTCLPKRNADYYKCIAIALFDDQVNLMMNEETDNKNWFRDEQLEMIYRGELYSEILQIIHRTALRYINSKDEINIYIAYDEESERTNFESFTVTPISTNLNYYFFNDKANIPAAHKLYDVSSYGRDKTIKQFAELTIKQLKQNNKESITLGRVSKSFQKYIKNHWNEKQEFINNELATYGLNIYIDYTDKRKPKKIKLI